MAASAGSPASNPLISTQSSELQAILHPLVLLSISDYITRHTLREHEGPIIGGLMGQHNGREVTIEHAFDCHILSAPDTPYKYRLDLEKVSARIEHLRAVHKDRNLDFVGWYTLLPSTGPSQELVQIHNSVLNHINESAILLGFHPQEILEHSVGGKLPLTIFESNLEVDDTSKSAGAAGSAADAEGDKKMTEDGELTVKLRFREIGYSVETNDAEMISMDFVARGSGNATAIEEPAPSQQQQQKPQGSEATTTGSKGKAPETQSSQAAAEDIPEEDVTLSNEEEEMLSALTAKANATKMLQSRVDLIIKYLESLPAEGTDTSTSSGNATDEETVVPSNTILRQIQALVGRLELIEPSDVDAFRKEVICEQNDVQLVCLLNDVMQSVQDMRQIGRKFDIVDSARAKDQRASQMAPWEAMTGTMGSNADMLM